MKRVLELYDEDFVRRACAALKIADVSHSLVDVSNAGLDGWAIEVADADFARAARVLDDEATKDAEEKSSHVCPRCGSKMISEPSDEESLPVEEYVCVKCGGSKVVVR